MCNLINAIVFALCLSLVMGCNKETKVEKKITESTNSLSNSNTANPKKSNVVKVIFVGQKDACPCTRKRVDTTWKTLQKVMDTRNDIMFENIQLDVDEKQADKLNDLRTIMVALGIYFFDINENLIKMLQGEVTLEQIKKIL